MLFPELSRKNTHGMAPSSYFFRGLFNRLTKRNRKKVFVLGFHKTGTTSLAKALLVLGYRVCGFVNPKPEFTPSTHTKQELFESRYKPLLKEYDAFEDTPWFIFYKELVELYPDAKFILSVRPTEQWYKSMVKHFGGYERKIFHWVYNQHGNPVGNKELYINTYNRHNKEVKEFLEKQNKDLLVMQLPEDFNWDILCGFLKCKKPIGDFPYANTASSRVTVKRKIIDFIKSWYYRYNIE